MKTLKTLLVLSSLALAATIPARGEISAAAALETYYLDPQPDRVPRLIRQLSHEAYLDRPGHTALAVGFFGALLVQHPDRVEGWLLELNGLPPKTNRFIAAALWQAGHPYGFDLLRHLGENSPLRAELARLADTPSQRIEDTPVQSSSSMNLQWGAFFATGDERYIQPIVAALNSSERPLATAARLAIAEQAAAHPRVLEICQAQLEREPQEIRARLQAALGQMALRPRG